MAPLPPSVGSDPCPGAPWPLGALHVPPAPPSGDGLGSGRPREPPAPRRPAAHGTAPRRPLQPGPPGPLPAPGAHPAPVVFGGRDNKGICTLLRLQLPQAGRELRAPPALCPRGGEGASLQQLMGVSGKLRHRAAALTCSLEPRLRGLQLPACTVAGARGTLRVAVPPAGCIGTRSPPAFETGSGQDQPQARGPFLLPAGPGVSTPMHR